MLNALFASLLRIHGFIAEYYRESNHILQDVPTILIFFLWARIVLKNIRGYQRTLDGECRKLTQNVVGNIGRQEIARRVLFNLRAREYMGVSARPIAAG